MEIHIGTTNIEESNEFLRCLWAEMKREFGICGWYYIPYKDGKRQKIKFGYMNINQGKPLEVGITYKDKGSINNIYFLIGYEGKEVKKGTELYQRLKKVVNSAKNNIGNHDIFYFRTVIQSYYPLMSYTADNFTINPINDEMFEFTFGIKAYDRNQAEGFAAQKVKQLMDFLSVETNAVFQSANPDDNDNTQNTHMELFQEEDFIDDYSVQDGYLVISKQGKQFINLITDLEQRISPEIELFLKACSHFRSARKQEEKMFHRDSDGAFMEFRGEDETELATTLYLSALEVATLIGFKEDKCESCGQPKFQISSRVRELTAKYLPKSLVKDFVDYYDKRSKYLHTGMKLVTQTPTKNLIPLLDPEDKNGCDFPYKIPLKNVREYVSYCLRRFYKENLL
jgi:hypothetical protein